jgi:hypothetical protein
LFLKRETIQQSFQKQKPKFQVKKVYQLIFAILALQMESVWGAANVEAAEWNADGGNLVAVTNIPSEPATQRPILISIFLNLFVKV